MAARVVWVAYLLAAFVVAPVVFRVRYGRWPFAYRLVPFDAYTAVDALYALALAVYTVLLLAGPAARPVSVGAGLGVFGAGYALQLWSVLWMGRNWRLGQRPGDDAGHVTGGPFVLRHPIYVSLLIIALGQSLLAGFDGRAVLLITSSAIYFCVQGRAEAAHWRRSPTR